MATNKIISFRPPRPLRNAVWRPAGWLALFGVALFAVCTAALSLDLAGRRVSYAAGDVAPETSTAPRRMSFSSSLRTREARNLATQQVTDIFDHDPNLLRQLRARAADLFRSISAIRSDTASPEDQRRSLIVRLEPGLSSSGVNAALAMSDQEWLATTAEALRVLDEHARERIRPDQLPSVRERAMAGLTTSLTDLQLTVVQDTIRLYIRPNMLLNTAETERARRDARDRVTPVQVTVARGEVLVRQGEIVTPEDMEKLEALGLTVRTVHWEALAGTAIVVAVLLAILTTYIFVFHHDLVNHPKQLLLLGLLIGAAVVSAKLIVPGQPLAGYVFPVAAVTILVSNLIHTQLAMVVAALLALLLAPVYGYSGEMFAVTAIGAQAGALAARRIERLNAFFLAGIQVALASLAIVLAFRLLTQDLDLWSIATIAGALAANGVLCAVLTMGTFSVAGNVFGITTMLQLLELAHPSQPLLRRLLVEAPGTYHHSIIVGNLAERAAEQLAVDSLLVRVGAYYHDIGKLHRPYYFIENQLEMENVHDHLPPEVSARALCDHVTEGTELARQYRLPRRVRQFIVEHHGTGLIPYFYRKAVAQSGVDAVDETRFRYPGPKPGSKETSLVMLADSVEAAVRWQQLSGRGRSTDTIEQLVAKVINDRLIEGQLDECDLTLRDLEIIRRSFARLLQGVYHPRIEYPDTVVADAVRDGQAR